MQNKNLKKYFFDNFYAIEKFLLLKKIKLLLTHEKKILFIMLFASLYFHNNRSKGAEFLN